MAQNTKGNGQRGVHPRVFLSLGGIRKTRPRNVPMLASNCLKLNSDAPPRHPQPMPRTHTAFFSGAVLGLTGPRRQRRNNIPTTWGVVPPQIYFLVIFVYYPLLTTFLLLMIEPIPPFDQVRHPQKRIQQGLLHVAAKQPAYTTSGTSSSSCE